jgi:hypothetical protein
MTEKNELEHVESPLTVTRECNESPHHEEPVTDTSHEESRLVNVTKEHLGQAFILTGAAKPEE